MTPYGRILRTPIAALAILYFAVAIAVADDRTAADVLPNSTVIFTEFRQPEVLLNSLYDHPVVRRIEALDQVRSAMEKKEYLDFQAGLAIVESQMGLPWRKIVGQAMGGGVAIALDANSNGVVMLARASHEGTQAKLLEVLANLARLDSNRKGNPDPITTSEYRGIKTYALAKGWLATAADWLLVTNKHELGKQMIDRLLDRPQESLAQEPQFAKAREAIGPAIPAWAYLNTTALRTAGTAKKLLDGQADNPLVELVIGGILSTLKQTPYATFALDGTEHDLQVVARAPHDRSWAGEPREYYFGPHGTGRAPPLLFVDQTIVSSSSYRDISGMWLRADDLFDKQTNEELAKAESGLSTLFGGKDFGQDILGAIRPETQFVVARQVFADGQPIPAIKLPAFGLVAELKDPIKMQPDLRRTFQSLIGFLNIVGAMNGEPQLDLDQEKTDSAQFVTASYLGNAEAKAGRAIKVNYNFSPSIAFIGNRFVLASTKTLTHTLASAKVTDRREDVADRVVNGDVVLKFDSLREVLADNRSQLVAQNMLTEGHGKDEAEKKIDELLELVGWFDRLELSLDSSEGELRLSLDVQLKAAN